MKPLRAALSILVLLAVLSWSKPASAGDLFDDFVDAMAIGFVVIVGVGGLVITDIVFTAHDASVYGDDERPTTAWAVGETLVTAPQAIFLDAGLVALAVEDDEDIGYLETVFYVPAIWINNLAVHGAWSWSAIDREPDPGALYGVPWLVGANTPATIYATARLARGLPARTPMAVAIMATSVPGLVVPSHQLATSEVATPGWVALTAWSGSLFAFGAGSVIVNALDAADEVDVDQAAGLPFTLMPSFDRDAAGRRAPGVMAVGLF